MTTLRFGATRQGPFAPVACQLGKYDAFTSTGEPVRSTSKLIRSSLVLMPLTCAGATVRAGGLGSAPRTRAHCDGPLAASITFHRLGSSYHETAAFSHDLPPLATPVMTTGCSESGATSAAPRTA